ncbi:pentatricopeptide repeat-containing protein At4g02750-like [Salvia miltiorrhiza]|uniref:pentatricopeptide repeat-containing protein At4g02750-like n=1 Tax=Salvia miltiorrhiza TaxID=226208 RepID=UPI0025AB83EC|nr:pentatricopeptide repeat-containing protein At4g02750-like [Salvia miltiorrhiza]
MHFRHLHTTILRSSRNGTGANGRYQNTSHLLEPPANKLPARPRSNNFTDADMVKCTLAIRNHMRNSQCDAALRLFNSMPRKNEFAYNAMISGYFSNGEFKLAQQMFDKMPTKDLVTRNIMIKGNIKNNNLGAARRLFDDMPVKDVVSWTTILSGYMQNGLMDEAKKVFDEMPEKNIVSWNAILSGYLQNGLLDEAKRVFDEMPAKNVVSWTAILSGYIQNGLMDEAKRVFDKMPVKNIVSWNVILFGYLQNGLLDEAKRVFDEMPVKNVVSWTTILSGYIQNGLMDKAKRVFDEMPVKNVFSWTAILSGYLQNGLLDLANRIFDEMPVKNIFSWNVILCGYMQNGLMNEARRIFDEMPNRDSVSWATMIGGYGQNGDNKEALRFFIEATRDWERLNTCAFAFVLSTCADIAAFELGKQIHGLVVKGGIEFKCNVGNALVSMYCSCGNIKEAYDVFKRIDDKDVISWNTIINGYARHGYGQEALQHFDSMKQTSIQPDEITMVGVLTACSHTGLVDKGTHYFYSMSQDHGIEPDIKHYNCFIDLLGRAGRLDEAQNLVKSMPFEPNGVTWTCLLSASRIHESTELGEMAAKMLLSLEPWNTSLYVLLSNLYAASGRWEDVKKMQLKMWGMGISKTTGSSWV